MTVILFYMTNVIRLVEKRKKTAPGLGMNRSSKNGQ